MATKPTGPSKGRSAGKAASASKTPARKRRSAPKTKPKTIDLKAEPAKSNTTTAAQAPAAKAQDGKKPAATEAEASKVVSTKPTETKSSDAKPAETKTTDAKTVETKSSVPKSGQSGGSPSNPQTATTSATTSATAPSKTASPSNGKTANDTSSGFGALLAASLIGGVIALGGAWILGAFEAGSDRNAQETNIVSVADLDATRAALEERIAAIQSAGTPDIAALVDARLAERPVADTGDASAAIDAARERIATLEATVAEQSATLSELRDAGPSTIAAQNDEELAALTTRVDEVATQVDSVSTGVEALRAATGDVAALTTRLDETEAAQANIGSRLDIIASSLEDATAAREAIADRIDGVTSQLDATGAALAALQQTVSQQSATIEERLSALASDLDARATAVESSTDQRIASLTDRIDNGADKLAARALAAAALKRDIDTGSPFDGSLQTLANVSTETSELDALRPYAESGVPTVFDLRNRFDSVAEEIRAATRETPPQQTFTERLLAGARNAVQINSDGDVQGDSVGGIIARIDQALANGALAKAGSEWATLPEAGRAASDTWHDALQARITADKVVGDTVDAFLNRNAAPTSN